MANVGIAGIGIREAGGAGLLFDAYLVDATGSVVNGGTTSLYIYEVQTDGTFKSYDFNDNTFKTGALGTETTTMSHRQGNNNTTDTGEWTYVLTTLTGFTVGSIIKYAVVNTSANFARSSYKFQYGGQVNSFRTNKLQSATSTTAVLDANASATDNIYKDWLLAIVGGTGLGQAAAIQSYVGSSKTATIFPSWTTTPDSTSVFCLIPNSQVDVGNWINGTIPAVNVAGVPLVDVKYLRGTQSVGAAGYVCVDWTTINAPTTTQALTGTTISSSQVVASVTGAVGSVTGAVGSVTGAVGSVTGNVSGNVTGSVGSLATQAKTDVENAVWDGLTASHSTSGSFGLLVKTDLDATVTSRMASYTQPAGFLAATFPLTVASTSNITSGTITTVSGNVSGNVVGSVGSLASQAKTDVENSMWNGLVASHTTAGSFGLLIGTDLDATITSRMASYTQPTGFLAATFPTTVASTTNITAGTITTVTNLTNAPTSGDLTSTMKTSVENAVWEAVAGSHITPGTFGETLNNTAASINPWVTTLPASYVPGQAGYIVGTFLDRAVSGAKLGSDGLDAIPTTAPTGVASTFREMWVQLWRRFFKKTTKNTGGDGAIKTYADDNTTVLTTQSYTETATSQEVDSAS